MDGSIKLVKHVQRHLQCPGDPHHDLKGWGGLPGLDALDVTLGQVGTLGQFPQAHALLIAHFTDKILQASHPFCLVFAGTPAPLM